MGINDYIKIGARIKKCRRLKGVKQKELAAKLGIPISTYANYENNHREPPSEILQSIADILETTVNDLMGFNTFDAKYNQNGQLADEVKVFETISKTFGENAAELVNDYNQLNETGQAKASEYVADLTEQEKYLKSQK
ncbi:MAG: helix-turn-helix domain-containing protein [Negativicutes bacterium]